MVFPSVGFRKDCWSMHLCFVILCTHLYFCLRAFVLKRFSVVLQLWHHHRWKPQSSLQGNFNMLTFGISDFHVLFSSVFPSCSLQSLYASHTDEICPLCLATTVESPADVLQGAEVPGWRATDQPQGVPYPVQQASQACQLGQPGKQSFDLFKILEFVCWQCCLFVVLPCCGFYVTFCHCNGFCCLFFPTGWPLHEQHHVWRPWTAGARQRLWQRSVKCFLGHCVLNVLCVDTWPK